MKNPILFQILNLFDLIEEKHNAYNALVKLNNDHKALQDVKANIEELKTKLEILEDILLMQACNNMH